MTELRPGDIFVNHRIEGLAGRGGMGVVYRATQLPLDRVVALKVIAPALADEPDFRARFVTESKAAASIEHPNVIPVYYAGEREGLLFIVMRYVDGPDLRALIRGGGALEPERAAHIVAQVGSALDAAHARGLVHRDVKPANVLTAPVGSADRGGARPEDHAYLSDFGLTKVAAATSGLSRTGGWVGTLGYVSPEQIRGERVDARSDVYALGCVLVHALTGHAPFLRDSDEATMWAHLNAPPPDESVPPEFAAVVARALAKDPSDRYPSAGDLGRAVLAASGRRAEAGPERLVARGAAAPEGRGEPVTERPAAFDAPTGEGETRPSPPAEDHGGATAREERFVAVEDEGDWFAPPPAPVPAAPGAAAVTRPTAHAGPAEAPTHPAPRAPGHAGARALAGRGPLIGAAALIAGAAIAVVLLASSGDPETPDRAATATTPRVQKTAVSDPIPVGTRPNALTVANGLVWAVSSADSDIAIIDAETSERDGRVDIGEGGASIAAGFDSVWVVKGNTQTLLRIDARTRRRVGPAIQLPEDGQAVAVVTGEKAVWVGVRSRDLGRNGPERVIKVTPSTGRQQTITVPGGVQDLAIGENAVWVTNRFRNSVVRISAADGGLKEIPVGNKPRGLAVGEGAVWVAAEEDDELTRINARTRNTTAVPLSATPARVAVGGGSVWVTSRATGEVLRVDPERRRVREELPVGRRPFAIFVDDGPPVWISLLRDDAVKRIDFQP